MKRYLAIWLVWLGVLGIAKIVPNVSDEAWFVVQTLWSSLLIMIILEIEITALTCSIAVIEATFMVIQLFACGGWRSPTSGLAHFYDNYAYYHYCVIIIEIIILLLSVPGGFLLIKNYLDMEFLGSKWRGLYNRIRVLW